MGHITGQTLDTLLSESAGVQGVGISEKLALGTDSGGGRAGLDLDFDFEGEKLWQQEEGCARRDRRWPMVDESHNGRVTQRKRTILA